jgi:uncharacterized membrane protein
LAFVETIRAPVERVFAYRLDVTKLPEYNTDVEALEALPARPDGLLAYRFKVRLNLAIRVRATLVVQEVMPPTRIVFEIASLMNAREVCTFEPATDGTRVRFETSVASPRGPIGRLVDRWFVAPSTRRQTIAELARMKERLEAQGSASSASA